MTKNRIWILGSSNLDYSYYMKQLPEKGATVHSDFLKIATGGKGANQAVAAAYWGADVKFIGAVGNDGIGQQLIDALSKHGIDTSAVEFVDGEQSGHAIIYIDEQGDNSIVVYGGANLRIPRAVESLADIQHQDVFTTQLEVNLDAIESYVALAKRRNAYMVLNPSPFEELPQELLNLFDMIVVNETEAFQMTGMEIVDPQTARDCGKRILQTTKARDIVITLGYQGAVLVTETACMHCAGHPVDVVDSQGAGDMFLGSLMAELSKSADIVKSVLFANWAAAISVTKQGSTQNSLPDGKPANPYVLGHFRKL